jgi:Integrase zinc binding domain
LLEQGPKEAKKDLMDWEVEEFKGENILFYKGKNYVPINAEVCREIVRRYHDHPTAGHPGELQTFNAVKEHYWWPGFESLSRTTSKDVEYVNNSKLTEIHQNQCLYL